MPHTYFVVIFMATSQNYFESKLFVESSEEDMHALLGRIHQEPGSHYLFAMVVLRVWITYTLHRS